MTASPRLIDRSSPAFQSELTRLDEASHKYVDLAAPVNFRLAETAQEREAAFRLRFDAVTSQGWRTPDQFPDGLEQEPADVRALHMVAWLEDRAIANCRMLFPVAGELLPLEEEFALRVQRAGEVVQIDRICVGHDGASERRFLLPALMSATWIEIRQRGFCVCAGLNTATMLRLYRFVGFEHDVLGPAQRSWSEDRYPVRFSPLNVRQRFYDVVGM